MAKFPDDKMEYTDVMACDYLEQCIKETMRLYTPASRYTVRSSDFLLPVHTFPFFQCQIIVFLLI